MGHQWTRNCKYAHCRKEFTTNSNGRLYCFKCSPARGANSPARQDRSKENKDGPPGNKRTNNDEFSDIDDMLNVVISNVDDIESQARAVPTRFQLGTNPLGDRVVMKQRPEGGWGRCAYADPISVLPVCIKERFYESTPYCYEHIRIFRDLRAKRMAQRMAGIDDRVKRITPADFKIGSSADAVAVLAKVANFVQQEWMTTSKAECIIKIVGAQMGALRQVREERKASADIQLLLARIHKMKGGVKKEGESDDPEFSAADEAEFKEIMERHGEEKPDPPPDPDGDAK